VVAAIGLAFGFQRSSHPSLDAQVTHIANQVRCPICDGETVAQSQVVQSVDIRIEIRQDLVAGQSSKQILASLVGSYGPGILESPRANGVGLIVWVLPVVVIAGMAAALALAFRRWRPPPEGPPASALDLTPAAVPTPAAATGPDPDQAPAAVAAGPDPSPGRRNRWILAGAGMALVVAGAAWSIVAAISSRSPGQTITGQAIGAQAEVADLQKAQADQSKGNVVGAIKEYQKVLAAYPGQPEALTGEGWLLAETQQPAVLAQGIQLLTEAETNSPSYVPAHLYRGLALLSENDYRDSIPELQWYLANGPDPSVAPRVRTALAQAQAALKATPTASTTTAPTTTTP